MQILGNGSIQPLENKSRYRCKKWRLWVSTDSGRYSRIHRGTWTSACKALESFKDELANKVPDSDTFAAYSASWLLWREKSGTLAPGTVANSRRDVAALCRSPLAQLALSTIAPSDCRDALMWIKENPVHDIDELSSTTMNKIAIALKQILAQAVDDGKIARNPMENIAIPKRDTQERQPLEPDELMRFVHDLNALPLDGRVVALYLMALLGLRRGEACAVYVDDIDGNLLTVHRAIKERDGTIGTPKSKASNRTLPIPPTLRDVLREWTITRAERGYDAQVLCCNTKNGILRPQLLDRWWRGDSQHNGIRELLGYPELTLHELRHSNLNMIARYLSPFDLQRYAGWSSIEPARVYIHDSLNELERAVGECYNVCKTSALFRDDLQSARYISANAKPHIGTFSHSPSSKQSSTQVAGSNPVHPTSDDARSDAS